MDLSRATYPLHVVVRVAFAVVVIAALAVDVWTLGSGASSVSLSAVFLVALLGTAWACWPTATPVLAIAASTASLLGTLSVTGEGLRFALFTEFVVLPVLFGTVLSSRAHWRWPIAVTVAAAAEAIALRADGPIRWIVAISMLVLLGAAVSAVVYVRLRDHERRTSVEMARQNERLDLARELHDVVGHHVTGIVVLAQASRFAAAPVGAIAAASPDTDRTLAAIEAAGLEVLTSIRRLVGLLRVDPSVAAGATLPAVEQLVDDLRRTHPDTHFEIDEATRIAWVPSDLADTVHRLVQESTTNVRKHGDSAGPVLFELRRTAETVTLSVENGTTERPVGAGYGTIGMRERVEALGGTFTAGPDGDHRWTVRAALPLVAIEHP